ncbi:MAG: hypothetical protein ACYTG1_08490, partial [Planctomycetota bacterium]
MGSRGPPGRTGRAALRPAAGTAMSRNASMSQAGSARPAARTTRGMFTIMRAAVSSPPPGASARSGTRTAGAKPRRKPTWPRIASPPSPASAATTVTARRSMARSGSSPCRTDLTGWRTSRTRVFGVVGRLAVRASGRAVRLSDFVGAARLDMGGG